MNWKQELNMKRIMKRIVIVMMMYSVVVMGQSVTDTALTKRMPFAVGISTSFSYMNGLWPSEREVYEGWPEKSVYGELQPGFEWNGHNIGVNVSYDINRSLSAGIGMCTRFKEKAVIESSHGARIVSEAWNGVIDVPITLEYHKRWYYVSGGVLIEHGKLFEGPPYSNTTIRWWHGGVTVSVGGCFHLSEHSAVKVGLEATAVFTPYAYDTADPVSMSLTRHHGMYANQSYGVTMGYVYHL